MNAENVATLKRKEENSVIAHGLIRCKIKPLFSYIIQTNLISKFGGMATISPTLWIYFVKICMFRFSCNIINFDC
jgi:hypothetical protein